MLSRGQFRPNRKHLATPNTAWASSQYTNHIKKSPTVKYQNAIHNSFGSKGQQSSTNTLIEEVQDATKDQ